MNIEVKEKQILIDGKPQIIISGEVHYFRLRRDEWQDRLTKLKEAGCNTVATYIPWICHNPIDGEIDLDGHTKPELDLAGFIDLCKENGLMCFMRPGPFIMAEVKNEGIPHWIYTKHPEVIPVCWDGTAPTTPTLDYLSPNFLMETKKWYEAVMPIISDRLCTKGGNVIAVQLDNEIGMLSWVSNCPDLTDNLLKDLVVWLKEKYTKEQLEERYNFALEDFEVYSVAIRSPKEEYSLELFKDLGYYMRHRFAKYIKTLREFSEENGVTDVPFVVNIHGTGGGRGFTYPIGISQLFESYTQGEGYISGSDIYFGNLTMDNFQDLYLCNAFMDSVHNEDQPLTSVEFECGDGNYGSTFGARYDVSAVDFKTRMCIAQGNRLLNYYLMTGGRNYRFENIDLNDGNNRIALTGERHGFAAPISPEGELNYTYPRMARVIKTMNANQDKLASMNEEHDNLTVAFIPDYYMTEYCYQGSEKAKSLKANLERNRTFAAWETVARAALLLGYRFNSTDIQNKEIDRTKTVIVFSASYMAENIQMKLKNHMDNGGNVFLYGEVPVYDMEGNSCRILADALGVKSITVPQWDPHFFLSAYGDGFASDRAESRLGYCQTFDIEKGNALLRIYGTDEICAYETEVGQGKCIVLAGNYNCDLEFFKRCFNHLGAKNKMHHDCAHHGIFMTKTVNKENEQYLHILNLDGLDKEFHVYENGEKLFHGNKILLQNKDGVMLPINVKFNDITINYATGEVTRVEENEIEFRLTQAQDVISLTTNREVLLSSDYEVEALEGKTVIKSLKHSKVDDCLVVRFR